MTAWGWVVADPTTPRGDGADDRPDVRDLLPAYALDAVDDVERRAVERLLAADPDARRELDEYNDLHTVSRRIAESSADGQLVDDQFERQLNGLRELVARLERTQADLHETALRARMVPVSGVEPRLARA